jgi:hypothetical protein
MEMVGEVQEMSKAYSKEKKGLVHGTLVSPEVWPSPHTPEEERQFQKLVKALQPLMMQTIQQNIDIFLEEKYDIHEGDTIQNIINYITNYFNTYITGLLYNDGPGIDGSALSSGTIKVEIGATPQGLKFDDTNNKELQVNYDQGLEMDSGQLEAMVNGDAAVGKDDNGIKVLLSGNVETGSGGGGGGLSFDSNDGVRVDPEDFLKLA